ncbi:Uncharacterized protein YukJ [Massilia sp. PDC64]|nr:YukJ family protein [Massilia sp. PDC64]SDE48562.1 Uncharacterized protein YukJ [Massilia sp. PDC64]
MPVSKYGVLKGTIAGHLRDADDDHYQILVNANGTMFRIAVNVKSSAPKAPSDLLFATSNRMPDTFVALLQELEPGYTRLASKPDGLALDYVRCGWIKPKTMRAVPPSVPGGDNDLKDKIEAAVVAAIRLEGSVVYAFGSKWGPEKDKKDRYFRFLPGNGIHDIHMNQGNGAGYRKDNGVFQDGGLIFEYPNGKRQAFFFAFQSQSFVTDDKTGNALGDRKPKKERGNGKAASER